MEQILKHENQKNKVFVIHFSYEYIQDLHCASSEARKSKNRGFHHTIFHTYTIRFT